MLAGDVEKRESCSFTLFIYKYFLCIHQDGSNIALRVRKSVFFFHWLARSGVFYGLIWELLDETLACVIQEVRLGGHNSFL